MRTAALTNGIKLFYVQDELPQVTVVLSAGYGRMYEDRESAGMAELMAQAVSLGGSKRFPGTVLHEKVDAMGGRFSIEAGWEHVLISIKVLDRFRDEALDIVADLAANPNMEEQYLDNAKALVADSIRRKYDDPAEIAFERARAIIFGGEGYGSTPTEAGVRSYSLERVRETWRKHFAGRNIMIGMYAPLGSRRPSGFAASALPRCRRAPPRCTRPTGRRPWTRWPHPGIKSSFTPRTYRSPRWSWARSRQISSMPGPIRSRS